MSVASFTHEQLLESRRGNCDHETSTSFVNMLLLTCLTISVRWETSATGKTQHFHLFVFERNTIPYDNRFHIPSVACLETRCQESVTDRGCKKKTGVDCISKYEDFIIFRSSMVWIDIVVRSCTTPVHVRLRRTNMD